MLVRALEFVPGGRAVGIEPGDVLPEAGWVWIDVTAAPGDVGELSALAGRLGLDVISARDAVKDVDLPKVDDFGSFLLVVLHALCEDRVGTYELDCFLSERRLVTVHDRRSPSVDVLWEGVRDRVGLRFGAAAVLRCLRRRASGRPAGAHLGRGLVEAARAPAYLVGAVFEVSTLPLRASAGSVAGFRRHRPAEPPDG